MKHVVAVAAACFGVALAVLLLSWTNYFSQLNSSAYDFTLRMAGEVRPASPTVIVAIDEASVSQIGRWPWRRDKLAQLIDRIQAERPRAIAIDLLLGDPSANEADDDALAASISRTPHIVLAAHIAPDGAPGWQKPLPKFQQPHVLLGHVHADISEFQEMDGVNRRIYTAKTSAGSSMLAFSLQALRAAGVNTAQQFERDIQGAKVHISSPVDIRFIGGRHSFDQLSAAEVLNGQTPRDSLKDRIVLIGLTTEGSGDEWLTPFSTQDGQKTSGVEIHANAIDTFFASRAISEASWASMFAGIFAAVLALWGLNRARRLEGLRFYLCAVLMLPATVALSWALLKYGNFWFPFPPLWTALVFVVPGLEVLEIVRVNRDLDAKIRRLSVWDPERNGWIAPLHAGELESEDHMLQRKRLLATTRRNARWRLSTIDFFSDDLVKFLSFNNAILDSIEDVIIVADATGRVVYQNPAAHRLKRFTESPPRATEYLGYLLDGRRFETTGSSYKSVPSHDGKRYYNVTISPIAQSGVVITLHDETAQHELNQAKSDMVSLVSHELRTPLTSIRGYTDMLMKYDLVAEKGKPFLSTIIDESRRLSGLIQSFLDIAYIESGRQKIEITDFELGPVLRDMLAVLGPIAEGKRIRLETPPDSRLTRVRADRVLLHQALTNLVTNAIKYSPAGTAVRVSVSNGNDRIRFQVSDEGCGIPAGEASRVFEKFYRRANKETRDQSGFGLGLAFVKEVAIKHGGDVFVESEVGKGSVFTLWIPA